MNSIRRNLLKWQIGALLATGLLASLITYALAWNAFNQMRNDGLVQIAYSIVRHGLVANEGDGEEEGDASDKGQFISQIWDGDGELLYTSLDNGGPPRHTILQNWPLPAVSAFPSVDLSPLPRVRSMGKRAVATRQRYGSALKA